MSLLSSPNQSKVNHTTHLTKLVLLLGIVSVGAYLRFANIPETISGAQTLHLSTFFAGLRLYLLPWWNFTDWLRQNFFKSLFYTTHGLSDTLFYYPVVKVYSLFNIPLTEWNLIAAQALLGTLTIVLVYCLIASLFDAPAGLIGATLLALSPAHMVFSTGGGSLTFVIFLQVSSVLAYLWSLRRPTWWTAILAAIMVGIQAGCTNFYYIAILLFLHFCHVHEEQGSLKENAISFRHSVLSWRSILIWSPYFLMWIINIYVYSRIGHQQDLTLLGHIFNYSSTSPYGVPISGLVTSAFRIINSSFRFDDILFYSYTVVYLFALAMNLGCARRFTMKGFVLWWSILVTALIMYSIRRQGAQNAVHLLLPSSMLIAATVSDGLKPVVLWLRARGQPRGAPVFGFLILALMLVLTSDILPTISKYSYGRYGRRHHYNSDVFRGMKAAGAVVRTLGNPKMNVFVLTTNEEALAPMEYYSGLSYSNSDYEPNQLFYHNVRYAPPGGILQPETLISAYCLKDFDFYVEFVREPPYPQKASEIARLKSRWVHLVAVIHRDTDNSQPEVRIYSSHAIPFGRYFISEQEDLFDRQFANTDNLFYNVNIGTGYFFGWHWDTEPMQACGGNRGKRPDKGVRARGLF